MAKALPHDLERTLIRVWTHLQDDIWRIPGAVIDTLGGRALCLGACPVCPREGTCWRCGRPAECGHPGHLLNAWLQSSVADLIRVAASELSLEPARLLMIRHDELLWAVPDTDLDDFCRLAWTVMTFSDKWRGTWFPAELQIRVRIKTGKRLSEMTTAEPLETEEDQ